MALLGDGELLMGASTLWSVAAYRPPNLIAVVLADNAYGITGRQPLNSPPRFADVAQSLGGIAGLRVQDEEQLSTALIRLPRPSLIEAEVTDAAWPGPSPFVDPAVVRLAFTANATRVSGPDS